MKSKIVYRWDGHSSWVGLNGREICDMGLRRVLRLTVNGEVGGSIITFHIDYNPDGRYMATDPYYSGDQVFIHDLEGKCVLYSGYVDIPLKIYEPFDFEVEAEWIED